MKSALLAMVAVLLAGCSAVGALPTVKYCDDVKYVRKGNTFEVHATDCKIPTGMRLLGLPGA